MLRTAPPGKNNSIYYLYYATQVMHHMQGESWRFWNEGVDAEGKKVHNGIRNSLMAQQDKGTTAQAPAPGRQLGRCAGRPRHGHLVVALVPGGVLPPPAVVSPRHRHQEGLVSPPSRARGVASSEPHVAAE